MKRKNRVKCDRDTMPFLQRLIHRQDGVSAVEFGLVLPILMLVLMGIIDYGHVYFVRLTLQNAAREGARVGVTRDEMSADTAAMDAANKYLTNAGISGSVTATSPSNAAPSVQVTVTVDPFTPLVGLVPTPDRLSVSATMRWELADATP